MELIFITRDMSRDALDMYRSYVPVPPIDVGSARSLGTERYMSKREIRDGLPMKPELIRTRV